MTGMHVSLLNRNERYVTKNSSRMLLIVNPHLSSLIPCLKEPIFYFLL